jgi:hypothetical protein
MTDDEKIKSYLRNHWPLSEIAAILDDSEKPIKFRTLQSWTTGQVLRIKPSLSVPGQRRKRYGLSSLLDFLIAKRLLQIAGLPAKAVQNFIDHYGRPDFLEGQDFKTKMEGRFILIQDGDKDAQILFFSAEKEERFFAAVQVLASADNALKWTTLSVRSLLDEALERLDCWNRRVEYKPVTIRDEVRNALNEFFRESNLSANRSKSRK